MNLLINLHLAFRALSRNKVRATLTMLGVVIGIASVIAIVAIGEGASSMIQNQINSMGRNLLMILPGAASSSGFSWGGGTSKTLTPHDATAIQKEIPTVQSVSPLERKRAQIIYGSQNWVPWQLYGVGPGFVEVRNWDLDEGNFITEHDVVTASRVCVLGKTVVANLFQGQDPVGRVIRIKNILFKVVGVLSQKGTNAMGMDQDDIVLVPWTTVKRVIEGSVFDDMDQVLLSVSSADAVPQTIKDVTALLNQRHHIREGMDSDFRILSMDEIASTVASTSQVLTLLLTLVASISLLVGGIGIMNIMLVSVVERTREIGIRMAVGARRRDILYQFLTESVVIATVAGALGMVLGVATSAVISRTLKWPTLISPESILIAILFSCGVGIFFGLYPAYRASRLDLIEALRYE